MRNKFNSIFVGIVLTVIAFFASSCHNEKDQQNYKDDLNATLKEPQIDRDYDAIKESGTLRMLTRYSSNTYFLHQGIEYGFEYELLKKFASEYELALDVVVVRDGENPYDMLNRGEGDVIAANYTITPVRQRYVDFTHPYNLVNQVLVFSGLLANPPQSLEQVIERNIPVTIRKNSSYYHRLQKLKKAGYPVHINLVSNNKDTESLLFDVSRGQYIATIADDNIFQASDNYMDNLVRGPIIAEGDSIAWAVRKNAGELKEKMNTFLSRQFRIEDSEEAPKRSAFLNVLRRKYFQHGPQIADYYNSESPLGLTGVISPYDELFKHYADSAGLDWLMLAAITAQETKFNPHAKSWTGAVGLMQVLPRYSQIDSVNLLYDARTNIREGVRILSEQLGHYAYMDSTSRWYFALAAYNAGQGHVADARRIAIDQHKNPNTWEPTSKALIKLMDRKYYTKARHGFCRGIETVNYVQGIMSRYQTYQTVMAMSEDKKGKSWPGVLGIFN